MLQILPNNEENPETTGNVSVTVKDENNNPIPGVEVIIGDGITGIEYTSTTGSAGGCNITNIPIGDYEAIAIKEDYEQHNENITIVAGNNNLNIILTMGWLFYDYRIRNLWFT